MKQIFHPEIMLLWLAAAAVYGQTDINGGRVIRGSWDASAAASTLPAKSGTSLPAACTVGEQFFRTNATAGQNLYLCTAVNTWTQVAGGGGTEHTQNTDTGTTSDVFQINSDAAGPKLKDEGSGVLAVRNAADDAYGRLKANSIELTGTRPGDTAIQAAPAGSPAAGHLYWWAADTNPGLWARTAGGVDSRTVTPLPADPTDHKWVSYIGQDGSQVRTQPKFADINDVVASSQLPNPAVGAKSGVESLSCTGTDKMIGIGTDGKPKCAADASGNVGPGQPNYTKPFTETQTVQIINTEHGFSASNCNVVVQCWDAGSPAQKIIEWDSVTKDASCNLTVHFATSQSGRCVVNGTGGATIARGIAALPTTQIAAHGSATVTLTATGVSPDDTATCSFVGSRVAVTGYAPPAALSVTPYTDTNAIKIDVVNETDAPVTPGAISVACRVAR